MTGRRDAPAVPDVIERLVKALVVTEKAVALYPPASNIPMDTAATAEAVLSEALQERPEVRLVITKSGLFFEDVPVFGGESAYESFATALYARHLADVRLHSGATAKDIVTFLSVLQYTPEEIAAAGGFESRLWDLGVGTVTVTDAHVSLVDAYGAIEDGAEPEHRQLTRSQIDEVLAAAYGGRPRDQLTVARFIGDAGAVKGYLTETYAGSGSTPDLLSAAERLAELAEIAYEVASGEERSRLFRSLGAAFSELDPAIKRQLLVEELLPEARTNEAVAALIRQMDVDEVCRALVEELDEQGASKDGLARAIRNLALISMSDRQEVVSAAGAAMIGAGFSEKTVTDVLEMASPTRLTVRERSTAGGQSERPVDTIFKLMDLAPAPDRDLGSSWEEPDVALIKTEAARGITDGDVIMALVSLVVMDARDNQFASTMSMLEDSLDLLIERGELDVAADTADALTAASRNLDLDEGQRSRLLRAIGRFTKPSDIRTIAHSLRLYKPGTTENDAARHLLDSLGALAIEPLLEQLAEEPDMGVRKSIVDLLSSMALKFISELGDHVSDPRWYVVRNVVSILGSTRASAVLPYLERVVRHPEPRVRREVIRSLSAVPDRFAHQMLASSLMDEDAQNVQLAARYLGAAGVTTAVPMLEEVARGEGRGNRDVGPRVEAIEALGRMGALQATGTLEALAGKRSILGAAKAREIRAAAESALARIRTAGGDAR